MRKLYLECLSGISGDMFVAAMLDLGVDENRLKETLASVTVSGFAVNVSRVKKLGLDVCDFDVMLDKAYENHDTDMEYLFGHAHDVHSHDGHGHVHGADNHDEHEHSHAHEHHHHHEHRGIAEVFDIIENTQLTANAKAIARKIFTILGEAEAKAHGATLETVHFHEVGAVDSIVDIIAAAFCIDELGIEDVIVPRLCEGQGTVRCAHGILPIPVPAVTHIVEKYNIRLSITDTHAELVTPTGAAIVAAIATENELPGCFKIEKTGMGAGKRSYDRPSILRMMIIDTSDDNKNKKNVLQNNSLSDGGNVVCADDIIYKLETNIDDVTGENLGFVMERLMAAGARDVHYTPVFMKKNRPAYQLNVICSGDMIEKMERIIFRETTTIGIRRVAMERTVLPREIREFDTSVGTVKVKVCDIAGDRRYYPEYESVANICRQTDMSYGEIYHIILEECHDRVDE